MCSPCFIVVGAYGEGRTHGQQLAGERNGGVAADDVLAMDEDDARAPGRDTARKDG